MSYKCVVLIKQVPDTRAITGDAMNDDGTVNRSKLASIPNPDDLHALEVALEIKEKFGATVTAISMGLPEATEVLREALYRGADNAILVTDRRCAGSDTLATSHILSCAIKKVGADIVLCGRHSIDGETAQVGPQIAEFIDAAQITCVGELKGVDGNSITARRVLDNGWQDVKAPLPCLLTVTDQANEPRVGAATRLMKYKNATTAANYDGDVNELKEKNLLIEQYDLDQLGVDLSRVGFEGSPTKINRTQKVILEAKEVKEISPTQEGISAMVKELIEDHSIN